VAAPVRRAARPWLSGLAAAGAVAYLAVMLATGALPRSRQVVEFEAHGVLAQPPEQVSRAVLRARGSRFVFLRAAGGWSREDGTGPLPAPVAGALERAVKFMHTSAPVRVFAAGEIADPTSAQFGLDRPQVAIALYGAPGLMLEAEFGSLNADGFLQYMRVPGRDQLYLMSRFVGAEWASVAEGTR
jgi:hypothetical protein